MPYMVIMFLHHKLSQWIIYCLFVDLTTADQTSYFLMNVGELKNFFKSGH